MIEPEIKLVTNSEKLSNVILALRRGDISECLVSDVKHADEVLASIVLLNDLAPGFFDEMLAIFIPRFAKQHNRAVIADLAQKRADADGFGDEWRDAITAGNSPKQKDYLAKMVALTMKAAGVNQNQAIGMAAAQLGREEDSIRKVVTRSKGRQKTKK